METPSEYVVGWGTLPLINAGIAQAKDRSGLPWSLGSLFFDPLATLLIVVLVQAALNRCLRVVTRFEKIAMKLL